MRALFLDRDGTLIVDTGYPRDPALVVPVPGAIEALQVLRERFVFVVVSNQSGIGRGIIAQAEADAVHARFVEVFAAAGIAFARVMYCPHAPEAGCACRKPLPQMLLDSGSPVVGAVMVGDKPADVAAGVAAGCAMSLLYAGDWPAIVQRLMLEPLL
jgi:histidinol-phosphate phosphatase family protein